jgi:hypothetical protein
MKHGVGLCMLCRRLWADIECQRAPDEVGGDIVTSAQESSALQQIWDGKPLGGLPTMYQDCRLLLQDKRSFEVRRPEGLVPPWRRSTGASKL